MFGIGSPSDSDVQSKYKFISGVWASQQNRKDLDSSKINDLRLMYNEATNIINRYNNTSKSSSERKAIMSELKKIENRYQKICG